jgi:hypothetical protein|tara:strand:+ start:2751 stop:2900 length:150 start_codon:yes stop_codon:yes gene_type:complete
MRRFGKGLKTVSSCTMTGGRKKENAVSLRRKLKNGKEKTQTQKKEKKSF